METVWEGLCNGSVRKGPFTRMEPRRSSRRPLPFIDTAALCDGEVFIGTGCAGGAASVNATPLSAAGQIACTHLFGQHHPWEQCGPMKRSRRVALTVGLAGYDSQVLLEAHLGCQDRPGDYQKAHAPVEELVVWGSHTLHWKEFQAASRLIGARESASFPFCG